jgi:hypothetical protein
MCGICGGSVCANGCSPTVWSTAWHIGRYLLFALVAIVASHWSILRAKLARLKKH